MDKNICCKKILWDSQTEKAAVLKLDVYIQKHEQKFGKILFQKMLSRKQLKLLRLMHKLMRAIEKAEIDKQQGTIL